MDVIAYTLGALAQKRECFVRYQELTQGLLTCEIDDILPGVEQREALREKIDAIDGALGEQIAQLEPERGALLTQAINNSCDYDAIPPEMQPVFAAAQQIFSTMSLIRRMEPELLERVEREKVGLVEEIKKLNQDSGAQAARFYPATDTSLPDGALLGERYRRI